jgi:plastocyanin
MPLSVLRSYDIMAITLRHAFLGSLLFFVAGLASAENFTITAKSNLTFSPANITINVGDTVTFKNGGGFHNVKSSSAGNAFRCAKGCDGAGGSGEPSDDAWTSVVTFNNPGSVQYLCEVHGASMGGTITVNGTAPGFTLGPGLSGNWYNPQQSGHGFQFEVLKDPVGFVTVFWFVFDNNGNQAWISGVGQINGNKLVMDSARRLGAKFPPNFVPTEAVGSPWGTLTFTFTDCTHGHVDWTSTDAAFTPTGSLDIERLTQVAGTTCP